MAIEPPSRNSLETSAQDLKLGISTDDLDTYHATVGGLLASWDVVDGLYATEVQQTMPERAWQEPEENTLSAWYVTTDLQTTDEGPLAGRTVAIKDNIAVAGVPMMNGSNTLRGFVPRRDATVVTRLLDAGAIIKGKAVCEDLCFSGGSHTTKTGPVRNPWNPYRSAGGSSSGSGALVAAGEVDLALGGDQGGSIRIPASYCGVVGHKPTYGLVPYTGAFPIELTIDHVGPIARSVADVAAMLTVLAGADGLDPRQPPGISGTDFVTALADERPLRIGVVSEGFEQANSDPAVNATVRRAVHQLSSNGHVAEEVSIPWHKYGAAIWDVISVEGAAWQMIEGNAYGRNWKGHYDPELIAFFGQRWRQEPGAFSETVKLVTLAGKYVLDNHYGAHYAKARDLEPVLTAAYNDVLASYDVLVMPTVPITATPIPRPDAPVADVLGRALEMIANTAPFDVTGHPACTVPAGLVEGLPVGLMVIGRRYDDAGVLRAANAFESTLGTIPAPQLREKEPTA